MYRVLSDQDLCFTVECHLGGKPPAIGYSAGPLRWNPAYQKYAERVLMGMLRVKPLGIGHDAGMLRPHQLVAIPPPLSPSASLEATAKSSLKPHFSAHLAQAGCGGSCLPMTVESLPSGFGLFFATSCGSPLKLPAPLQVPVIPFQFSVWTGLTAGDIFGGLTNMYVDVAFSGVLGYLGNNTKSDFLKGLLKALPFRSMVGKYLGINFDTGFSNPGSVVQKAIDRDGVSSDAQPGFRVGGYGLKGGKFVAPWSA
jgi:hypothetical protein